MNSIYCTDVDSSVMLLGAAWGSEPGGSYWVSGSNESFCQDSLGMGILEYLLRRHSFGKVIFPVCRAFSVPLPGFYTFLGLCPSLCAPQFCMCCQIPHGNGGNISSSGV